MKNDNNIDYIYNTDNKHFNKIQNKVYENIHKRLKQMPKDLQKQIEWELKHIETPDNTISFYIAMTICEMAKQNNLPVSIRGSIGNSLVAYILGISDFNPLKYNLQPELLFGNCGDKAIDITLNVPSQHIVFFREQLKHIIYDHPIIAQYEGFDYKTARIGNYMYWIMTDDFNESRIINRKELKGGAV